MTTSRKLKNAAIIFTCVGLILIVVGIVTVCTYKEGDSNASAFIARCVIGFAGGGLSLFISFPLWFLGFTTNITGGLANLEQEAISKNKESLTELSKSYVDVHTPVIKYAIDKNADNLKYAIDKNANNLKKGVSIIKGELSEEEIEKEIKKYDNLLKKGVITQEEYDSARRKILKID